MTKLKASNFFQNTFFIVSSLAMQSGVIYYAEKTEQARYKKLKEQHPNATITREYQPLSSVGGYFMWKVERQKLKSSDGACNAKDEALSMKR